MCHDLDGLILYAPTYRCPPLSCSASLHVPDKCIGTVKDCIGWLVLYRICSVQSGEVDRCRHHVDCGSWDPRNMFRDTICPRQSTHILTPPPLTPHLAHNNLRLLQFPKFDDVHPFYADLMNVLYDKDHYKLALGQINTARHLVAKWVDVTHSPIPRPLLCIPRLSCLNNW